MKRTKLVAARAKKNWTLEQAAEEIGCASNTLDRWELGVMSPSIIYIERLCTVYGSTAEELGLHEPTNIPLFSFPKTSRGVLALVDADLTMRFLSIVYSHHSNPKKLQYALSRRIEESIIMDTSHEAALTRRDALQRLAMFPLLFTASGSIQRPIEEILNHCAASITACRYLNNGTHDDMVLASSLLSSNLPVLKAIVKESSAHRKEAANLVAQTYLLKYSLGLHLDGPTVTIEKGYAKLAVTYSQESGDPLLHLNALKNLTWAYNHIMHYPEALQTIEEAASIASKKSDLPSPSEMGIILSMLALMKVKNGIDPQDTLRLVQEFLADPFSNKKRKDGTTKKFLRSQNETFPHQDLEYDYVRIIRNQGLVYYYQRKPVEALKSYNLIMKDDFTSNIQMPRRTHVELLNDQLMAMLKNPERDREQVTKLWQTNAQGAIDLQSQQRFEEACMSYEVMTGIWPGNPRVEELRDLLVHW